MGVGLVFTPLLGAVIAAAMIINICTAGLAGVIVPVMFERLDQDPAVASSVFVTMITDSMGFFVFLGLAVASGMVGVSRRPSVPVGAGPQRIRHRIELGEIHSAAERIVAIEHERPALGEQPPPERTLEQAKAHQRLVERHFGCPRAQRRPVRLDLPDALADHLVIGAVRPAMQRQAHAHGGAVAGRQQQAVMAKIVKSYAIAADHVEQRTKAAARQQLPGQQVMALHPWDMRRQSAPVDSAKGSFCDV